MVSSSSSRNGSSICRLPLIVDRYVVLNLGGSGSRSRRNLMASSQWLDDDTLAFSYKCLVNKDRLSSLLVSTWDLSWCLEKSLLDLWMLG